MSGVWRQASLLLRLAWSEARRPPSDQSFGLFLALASASHVLAAASSLVISFRPHPTALQADGTLEASLFRKPLTPRDLRLVHRLGPVHQSCWLLPSLRSQCGLAANRTCGDHRAARSTPTAARRPQYARRTPSCRRRLIPSHACVCLSMLHCWLHPTAAASNVRWSGVIPPQAQADASCRWLRSAIPALENRCRRCCSRCPIRIQTCMQEPKYDTGIYSRTALLRASAPRSTSSQHLPAAILSYARP